MARITISTVEELRHCMAIKCGGIVSDEDLIWFVSTRNAKALSNVRTKDLAAMVSKGVTAINSLVRVQEHISNLYDYEDDGSIDWDNEFNDKQLNALLDDINYFYYVTIREEDDE
jgi:hypothetical protein